MRNTALEDLDQVLDEYREGFRNLTDDDRFVCWFLRAFVTDSTTAAASALTGGSGDKGVDAIYIDEDAKVCFVVQGKYRTKGQGKAESRSDVVAFGQLAHDIFAEDQTWKDIRKKLKPDVAAKLSQVRDRVTGRQFAAHFYFVTTGTVSKATREDALRASRNQGAATVLQVFDEPRVRRLVHDYLDGVAPPVPSLDLPIQGGSGSVLQRFDDVTEIDSWIFSMTDVDIGDLFKRVGIRLFARNIRGFLGGNTVVNRGIEQTLEKEPERFWYYNNGVTVICDEARLEREKGRHVLRVSNPQIINGQQTTRTLASSALTKPRASVLVRVISVPREDGKVDGGQFEALVSKVVSATNSQNAVRPSDLMSNDRRQIDIERQLRNRGYWYIRKRQTKGEVRRAGAGRHYVLMKKEELAQAVAACDLDPSIVREGVDRLFEEKLYTRVFGSTDARYYLARYWVVRHARYGVRHGPDRSYAKWLVANFIWSRLGSRLRNAATFQTFLEISELGGRDLRSLDDAVNAVFKAAARFHRRARDREEAGDWSAFSRRRNLSQQFERFWGSSDNGSRRSFDAAWRRFDKTLSGPRA